MPTVTLCHTGTLSSLFPLLMEFQQPRDVCTPPGKRQGTYYQYGSLDACFTDWNVFCVTVSVWSFVFVCTVRTSSVAEGSKRFRRFKVQLLFFLGERASLDTVFVWDFDLTQDRRYPPFLLNRFCPW